MLSEESPWWDKKVPGVCSRDQLRGDRQDKRARGERGTKFHQHKELIAVSSEARK